MDLFLESTLDFSKTATAEVTLPDDPAMWPTEILQELYKQVPYIADFMPDIVMDRVDAEQRFGFGHVEVSNKTEIQSPQGSPMMQAAGVRSARIPIIIKEGKLQPFDVIVTEKSKMLPLTERRLRQALFRPQLFDVTSRTPGDQSMISQLYPPYRQNYGFGGGGAVMTAGMGKEGSAKKASLIEAILPTIDPIDFQRFAVTVAEPKVKAAYYVNKAATQPSVEVLAKYEAKDLSARSEKLAQAVHPSVMQFVRTDQGYVVKTASHKFWAPIERALDNGQLYDLVGNETMMAINKHGAVTMADEAAIGSDQPEADRPEAIKDFGIYRVEDEQGKQIVGFVFPNLLDIDGEALPLALFTNGSQAAVQSDLAGVRVASGASLMEGHPRGHGVFYQVLPNGSAQATIPLTITSSLSTPEEAGSLVAETMDGRQVTVSIQPNMQRIVMGDESHMVIPDTFRWLPLDDAEEVVLKEVPEQFSKQAAPNSVGAVTLRASGMDSFSISGEPTEKIAEDQRTFLSVDDAMFLLAGFGVTPEYAMQKIGEALSFHMPIEVPIGRRIETESEVREEMAKKASTLLDRMPSLRVDLVKEAAAIPDPTAVDSVLSLGFINPENMMTFVSYLPQLDEAQSKLCELLMAARLGMKELPEEAIERAIHGLEGAIEGLNVIAFNKSN